MSYTGHGHYIPGTPPSSGVQPTGVAKCGGVQLCPRCIDDVQHYRELYGSPVPANVPEDFQAKAKQILVNYIDSHYSQSFEKPVFEVYVVWFAKVLQNWKVLLSTDRPDGRYYELTYNGDKRVTYIDEYAHLRNTPVPD